MLSPWTVTSTFIYRIIVGREEVEGVIRTGVMVEDVMENGIVLHVV